jgi:predicted RNase H-like nuclease (RuvC/YqgF family)
MLDNLPDWVGPAVAALIAGVFGTLAAMAKARGDNEAREDERLQKAVDSYYTAIRGDVDKLREDVERQRARIRELETALALRTNELTELRDQHDALKLDYTDLSQHVEELRALLAKEGRELPPLPRPRRPRRGGGE